MLAAMVCSSNGKIPAGSVPIKLTENGALVLSSDECEQPLEKCLDKNAKVEYSIKI